MIDAYRIYRLLSSAAFLSLFPPFWVLSGCRGRYKEDLPQRLGKYPVFLEPRSLRAGYRIWVHTASVGEVGVAAALIESLLAKVPGIEFVLSTTTSHGKAHALSQTQGKAECVLAPVDFPAAVRKALKTVRPDVLVMVETEIWPNWLFEAERMGIRIALVNGRISSRSIGRYLKIRPLIKATLERIEVFSMTSGRDADYIRRLGAPPDRVFVNGNAKYDLLIKKADPEASSRVRQVYGLDPKSPVVVGGSLRGNEPEILLSAFGQIRKRFPDTVLILVPRHVERSLSVLQTARRQGWKCCLRTDLNDSDKTSAYDVVVVDTIGELMATYSLASVVFSGGSLVPFGGQNLLEAAAWGKPVLHGPSMDDFQDACLLLGKTGGSIEVRDEATLAGEIIRLLSNPDAAEKLGAKAREAVLMNTGAADRHTALIRSLLQ